MRSRGRVTWHSRGRVQGGGFRGARGRVQGGGFTGRVTWYSSRGSGQGGGGAGGGAGLGMRGAT